MNINQLKYVLVIAESSSMREAVGRLYVSQPALSASVRDLEDELGIVIFERSNKGIKLTDEGREFLNYAKKAVGQYMLLEERYLSQDKEKEHFSVSMQHYNFAARAFAEVVSRFDLPKYVFLIHETKTMEVLENVRDLKSEVGVLSYSETNKDFVLKLIKEYGLEFVPLMRRETYIYLWKGHPLSDKSELSLEELKDYPCISFDQGEDGKFYITEEAMGDHDFDKSIRSDDRATTMELIAWLKGYSVGSGILSEEGLLVKDLVSIKLKEEDSLIIGYITKKNRKLSKYGAAYVEELVKYKEKV
ncbi:MAG: LysR family transcriptional regulator [Lachnospiraceae bacterium]|nr:LysR family transcriptional regulator [Lachnospiraceae bacterium]